LLVDPDRLRLMTKAARMYHERGLRQPEIAAQLRISQPRVSRLLKQAVEAGIVRTTVVPPAGVYAELEEQVELGYGLQDVVVADVEDGDLLPALGAATAVYLETTLLGSDHIGLSSWSSTLLAAVDRMRPRTAPTAEQVVQVLGGVGSGTAQEHATRLVGRLAQLTRAEAVFLQVPGFVSSAAVRDGLLQEASVKPVTDTWDELTVVLAGIGALEPSALLRESGNAISEADQAELERLGAVGDICLRFFDAHGAPVAASLEERVIGISADQLRRAPRTVGVAGGPAKYTAIRAALLGGWLSVLITDLATARRLAADVPSTVPVTRAAVA
jgi:DNA-binding transcriptional regulator LsrR (DeoR family)